MQKKYVEAKGKDFGTVTGGTMCSGPFKLDAWQTGKGVKMVPNPELLGLLAPQAEADEPHAHRRARRRDAHRGRQDRRDRTAATHRALAPSTQLSNDPSVKVYQGAPFLAPPR